MSSSAFHPALMAGIIHDYEYCWNVFEIDVNACTTACVTYIFSRPVAILSHANGVKGMRVYNRSLCLLAETRKKGGVEPRVFTIQSQALSAILKLLVVRSSIVLSKLLTLYCCNGTNGNSFGLTSFAGTEDLQ